MQTFLPYPDYEETAKVLDDRRLGKQRVECFQIMERLLVVKLDSWSGHPAVLMWEWAEKELLAYFVAICEEWERRGFENNMFSKMLVLVRGQTLFSEAPKWKGVPGFHESHQSNLVRKDPGHYGPLFPDVPPDLPYVWPTKYFTPPSELEDTA